MALFSNPFAPQPNQMNNNNNPFKFQPQMMGEWGAQTQQNAYNPYTPFNAPAPTNANGPAPNAFNVPGPVDYGSPAPTAFGEPAPLGSGNQAPLAAPPTWGNWNYYNPDRRWGRRKDIDTRPTPPDKWTGEGDPNVWNRWRPEGYRRRRNWNRTENRTGEKWSPWRWFGKNVPEDGRLWSGDEDPARNLRWTKDAGYGYRRKNLWNNPDTGPQWGDWTWFGKSPAPNGNIWTGEAPPPVDLRWNPRGYRRKRNP